MAARRWYLRERDSPAAVLEGYVSRGGATGVDYGVERVALAMKEPKVW
jgi:hypothetical protein